MSFVTATYYLESFLPLELAAETVAGEQSSGTHVALARENAQLKARHRAEVVEIEPLPAPERPSLPGARRGSTPQLAAGKVRIRFPLHNFGPSIPNLLSCIAGNLFELSELSGVRLLDVDLPDAFAMQYPGPRFGIAGTRRLMNLPRGVMIGTIVKPSIGLEREAFRDLVRELVASGMDFIKDDELQADPPYFPLAERVAIAMEEIVRGEKRYGKRCMYAFNITADITELRRNYELVENAGGNCVMLNINAVGLSATAYVRGFSKLPIHGHRAMIGALMRHPALGIDFVAFQKLARLAGVDHLHTNGMGNKFYETDDEVERSVRAVLTPLFGGYETLPVLSSGQTARSAPPTFERLRTDDVLLLAGGGIQGHPGGAADGVASIRQAFAAVEAGRSLEDYAVDHEPLRRALETFAPS